MVEVLNKKDLLSTVAVIPGKGKQWIEKKWEKK